MAERSTWDAEARRAFAGARDGERLGVAVMKFHRRLDEVIDASLAGHAVKVACTRGCSFCCSLQVQVQPHEAFTLGAGMAAQPVGEREEIGRAHV